jgi:hypothetical protein
MSYLILPRGNNLQKTIDPGDLRPGLTYCVGQLGGECQGLSTTGVPQI